MLSFLKKLILKKNSYFYRYFLSPISNINGVKNYIKISSYFIRNEGANFSQFKYAIYFDNEDPAAILQIDKWFSQGFFEKNNTLVLFRIYSSSLQNHISFLEKNNYNFYGFRVLKYFELNSSQLKFIFYPFNSFTNPVLIKNRDIKHIWIAHGESDKLASVNPMIRMYDFIFVSGNISIHRLLHYKIINKCDIENKIIRIGIPYLGKLHLEKKVNSKMKILYAPTWEGVEVEQQYSSLENNFGLEVIKKINEKYKDSEVYYMPHPSTGIKNSSYIDHAKDIILKSINNKDFFVVQNKNSYLYNHILNIINPNRYLENITNFEDFDLVITDVSSIIANLIYYKVNYVVLVKNYVVEHHLSKDNNMIKDMPLLSISNIIYETQRETFQDIINQELKSDKQDKFNKLISFESDKKKEQNLEFYINIMSNR